MKKIFSKTIPVSLLLIGFIVPLNAQETETLPKPMRRNVIPIPAAGSGVNQDGASEKKYSVISKENIKDRTFFMKIKPEVMSVRARYPNWQDIDNEKIEFEMKEAGPILIQLCVPDTWNYEGIGSWFGIEINGKIVSQLCFTSMNDQKIPIMLSTIENLQPGTYTVKSKWCVMSYGVSCIGNWSTYQFMVTKL